MKKLIALALFILLLPSLSWGVACNTTIASTDTFPCEMSTASATYTLSENIICDTTCFTVTANNVTLDLNTKTMTWGNTNGVITLNSDFTDWADISTPNNWTILSGTVTQAASQWPDHTYDAILSSTASIKSGNVTLTANQTYWYGTWLRGTAGDNYTIYIKRTSDDVVLATGIITQPGFTGGTASEGYLVGTSDHTYKPTENVEIYLQIDCTGTYVKRVAMAQIAAARQYGIFNMNYKDDRYAPDLDPSLFGGVTNLKVTSTGGKGIIAQGSANAFFSGAIVLLSVQGITIENINITMTGRNTGSVYLVPSSGNILIDDVDSNTTSDANASRMHIVQGMTVQAGASVGSVEVKNCNFDNDPMTGIGVGALSTFSGTISVHNNTVRNKEYMADGYAMGIGGKNVTFYGNVIQPYRGRGLMIGEIINGDIYSNVINANDEVYVFEYPTSLETYAIRARTSELAELGYAARWMQNVKIRDNQISASLKETGGVDAVYGIYLTNTYSLDSIESYNNIINVTTVTGKPGYGVQWLMSKNDIKQIFRNNSVTSNDRGVKIVGHSPLWPATTGLRIYSNKFNTQNDSFYFSINNSGALITDIDIYCNQETNQGVSSYPFYLSGNLSASISDIHVSNNQITNSNSGDYEVYSVADMSSLMYFCGNGTIDVGGGGSVGSETPCQDGSTGCYADAGILGAYYVPYKGFSSRGGAFR